MVIFFTRKKDNHDACKDRKRLRILSLFLYSFRDSEAELLLNIVSCMYMYRTDRGLFCWKLNTQLKGYWRFSILTILCCGKICFFLFHWGFHTPSQTDEHGLYKNKLLQLLFIWSSFDDYNSWNDINNLHVGFLGIVRVNNVNINILCIVKY